jgi:hypothetical protein
MRMSPAAGPKSTGCPATLVVVAEDEVVVVVATVVVVVGAVVVVLVSVVVVAGCVVVVAAGAVVVVEVSAVVVVVSSAVPPHAVANSASAMRIGVALLIPLRRNGTRFWVTESFYSQQRAQPRYPPSRCGYSLVAIDPVGGKT